jgi:hypothetical protein
MAQNFAFLNYGQTFAQAIGGAIGAVTLTIGTSATGLPATAARIWNSGTGVAFISFGTTPTVSSASSMIMPVSVAPYVLRTGGSSVVQMTTTGTVTTTVYITGGEGID